eukprot:3608384-Amphidinium_carterae.1
MVFGALPQLIQVLQSQTRDRLPSFADTKRSRKPAMFSGKEEEWRESSVKFESFVVGVCGNDMRVVFAWASEQEVDITEREIDLKFLLAANYYTLRLAQAGDVATART